MSSILVAYASTGGSTREVAEFVATTLHDAGLEVVLKPVTEVPSLEGYGSIILGAPIYNTLLHTDARLFLNRNKADFGDLKVAVFALGPVGKGDAQAFKYSRAQLDMELKRFPWIQPVALEMFGGKMKATDSGFLLNKIFKPTPAVDYRDWDAIKAWAEALPEKIKD
jgi:menaquinone-dependent protoporphyrinogen oxidase